VGKKQRCTSNASLGGMYWKGNGYHLQFMRQYVKMRGRGGGGPHHFRVQKRQKKRLLIGVKKKKIKNEGGGGGGSHHFTVHELPKKKETKNERNVHNPENK